jgi:multicomponent Na+:H+ antiporter subunit E
VVLWLLAWGEISLATLLSGVVVAAALLAVFPLGPGSGSPSRVSLVGAVQLAAWVAVQLVVSSVTMIREIVRRHPRAHPGVVVHRLARPSEHLVTLMSSVISLSPGTMTVDAAADSSTIAVHVYDLRDVERARKVLARLERLAVRAIGPRPGEPSPTVPAEKEQP